MVAFKLIVWHIIWQVHSFERWYYYYCYQYRPQHQRASHCGAHPSDDRILGFGFARSIIQTVLCMYGLAEQRRCANIGLRPPQLDSPKNMIANLRLFEIPVQVLGTKFGLRVDLPDDCEPQSMCPWQLIIILYVICLWNWSDSNYCQIGGCCCCCCYRPIVVRI